MKSRNTERLARKIARHPAVNEKLTISGVPAPLHLARIIECRERGPRRRTARN